MGKVIGCIYKYGQRNWPYTSSNITLIISANFYNSIQTQRNSASDASVGANDVASSGSDQITNHHGNMDSKDNDDSRSFETPRKNNFPSSYFGDTITTTTKPRSSTLYPPGNGYLCFQIEGGGVHAAQCVK